MLAGILVFFTLSLSLLTPLLLAAPSTSFPRSPSTLFPKRYMLQCFTHTAGANPLPTNTHDCLEALSDWQCDSRVQLGLTSYSRSSAGVDIKVPVTYRHGTCLFGINLKRRTSAVLVSRIDILQRAQELIVSCVTPPIGNPIGGTVTVGDGDVLELKVSGEPGQQPGMGTRPLYFRQGFCRGSW